MIFPSKKLVLATHNSSKIKELKNSLSELKLTLNSAKDFHLESPEETGQTFEENAKIKAQYVSKHTGLYALADDSGLVIDVLGGAPGVYSSDWAINSDGERNFSYAIEKIKQALIKKDALDLPYKSAKFVCVLCIASPEQDVHFFRGEVKGQIVLPSRGDKGFGYDPIFQPEGDFRTFGEMSLDEKQGRTGSHRSRAIREFLNVYLNENQHSRLKD